MKKLSIMAVVVSVIGALLSPSAANANQDSWAPHLPGHGTVTLIGMNGEGTTESTMYRNIFGGDQFKECAVLGAGNCELGQADENKAYIHASAVLPLCDSSNVGYCVKDVNLYKSGESKTAATFLGESQGKKFAAQPDFNLPRGGGALIFDAPGVPHAGGGTHYAVVASYVMLCSGPTYKCGYNSFYINVQPFSNSQDPTNYLTAERFDFAPDTRVGVTVQAPQEIGGWFAGRINDPNLQINKISDKPGFTEISLDAEALTVSRMSANVPNDKYTPQMTALSMPPDAHVGIESGYDTAVSWVEELRPFVNDTAVGAITVWQLKSIFLPNRECYPPNQVNGLVTTNAVGYSWNPPEFKDGFLNYKMAGLHYNKDGTLSRGTYDLIMRSDVARCLYRFSSAPISATVQVLAADGSNEEVATSTVSEKDGWLKIAAYGFTFSSPTVQVKIEGQKTTEAYTGTGSVVVPKKKSITCKKGSTTKKITALKPSCPKGWKKVAK